MDSIEFPVPLSDLIDVVLSLYPGGDPLERVAEATAVADRLGEMGDHLVGHFVDQARLAGVPWREIGASLGVTKQAVQKRFVPGPDDARAGDRRIYRRFTEHARTALRVADEIADSAGFGQVWAEHLVWAVLRDPDALAAEALAAMAGSLSRVRAALGSAPVRPSGREQDPVTLSVELRTVVDRAAQEALRLGHEQVGTEHLLWAVMAESDCFAAAALRTVEVSQAESSHWLAIGAGRRGERPRRLRDGDAVAACRALLEREGVSSPERWRITVVTDDTDWVVRMWTDIPAQQARPWGTPDRIYRVSADQAEGTLDIEQVHPKR